MSILSSLERAYHRLAKENKVPPFGYFDEPIHYCIILNTNGQPVAAPPADLRDLSGKRPIVPRCFVPKLEDRTSDIMSQFLWDNTSYVLGVAKGSKNLERVEKEQEAFRDRHLDALHRENDAGLVACYRFLQWWTPEYFDALGWPEEMKGANVVFRLDGDLNFIHEREAARQLWTLQIDRALNSDQAVCLVTGRKAPIDRKHPSIKHGAKPSSAIVSFNLDVFESYGHKQGNNAPVSKEASHAYVKALNHFLPSKTNKVQLGDASTVFWADGSNEEEAAQSEAIFASFCNDADDTGDEISEQAIKSILEKMARGRPMEEIRPDLPRGVRFYVLGLAPNAARISLRFWLEDDFATIAEHILWHYRDMRLDPPPRQGRPSVRCCLREVATTKVRNPYEHIPPQLAGEMLRAILTGRSYPQTLLSTILMRLRSDKAITDLRVALIKAVVCRNRRTAGHLTKEDDLVSLDPTNADPGYLLGRLFACFEYAQTQALGGRVNATICDKYYGAASATPRSVFPILQRNAMNHLSRLRKDQPARHRYIDSAIAHIYELVRAEELWVATLTMERQAFFAIGYYHQKNAFYTKAASSEESKKEKENGE